MAVKHEDPVVNSAFATMRLRSAELCSWAGNMDDAFTQRAGGLLGPEGVGHSVDWVRYGMR